MEDEEEYEGSDAAHNLLISAVSKLDKIQHIKVPTRSEATNLNSEFDLTKSSKKINIENVVKVLGNTAQHVQIGKNLKKTQDSSKILQKPLEKPQAERLKRSTGYSETKNKVGRWDPVVSLNRTLDCVYFPLKQSKDKLQPSGEFISKFELKSPLELELDEVDPPAPVEEEEEEEPVYPMTYQEMVEQREHLAKMRALQSFKAAKAKRQSKIKSKKYHRILKKEKLKQQLREFEELQKTDPEEALKKLDALEKERALERHTLRHKNTGKWAKSKLVRAKYDKDVRQQLAEQLSVARNLTKKIQDSESSEEENENNQDVTLSQDPMNPWMLKRSDKSNIDAEFDFGYKQYLKNKTLNKKDDSESESDDAEESKAPACNLKLHHNISAELHKYQTDVDVNGSYKEDLQVNKNNTDKTTIKKSVEIENNIIEVNVNKNRNKRQMDTEDNDTAFKAERDDCFYTLKNKKQKSISTDNWEVHDEGKIDNTLADAFDSLESSMADKLSEKLKLIREQVERQERNKKPSEHTKRQDRDNLEYLEFKKQNKAIIDEELMETTSKDTREYKKKEDLLKEASKPLVNDDSNTGNIDPNRFIQAKPKYLNTAIAEGDNDVDALDDDEQIVQRVNIEDVFEDDDVVASFRQEKEDEANKNKSQHIDLGLPGWGKWGGKGIKAPRRKRNRFITKGAPKTPRRDDNKGDIIIKEYKDPKLAVHKITEIPFPFKTVKDFEASIRAPLGNTFVPENAYRSLIQPSKITKAGAIINPMDEDELISKKTMNYIDKTVVEILSKNKKKK